MDYPTIVSLTQQALNEVVKWCKRPDIDLGVSPDKTQAILFTKKRKTKLIPLKIEGVDVPYTKVVKYLGIFLDDKLLWNTQCQEKSRKATMALAQCKRAIGKTWGLSPYITHWIYSAIIRPALDYGALVWVEAVDQETNLKPLARVQRQGLVSTFGVMRSTPTAAMETLIDLRPMDIHIRQVALRTMHRLLLSNDWKKSSDNKLARRTHTQICERLAKEIPEMRLPCETMDLLPTERKFKIQIIPRTEWKKKGAPALTPETVSCYTDGSRLGGAACLVYSTPTGDEEIRLPLGKYPTVFQSEVFAIIRAAETLIQDMTGKETNIYSDSLSTLQSLQSPWKQTSLVRNCFKALNTLANDRPVTVHWIPAHSGYEGNERVDSLAK